MFLSAAHITKWLWICPLSTWVEQTKAYLFSKVRSINSRPILWASSGVTSSVGMQWSYALLWWRDMGMLQLWLHWRVLKESCKWNFQFGPLLWVLNLIENNVLEGGFKWTPFWTPRMVQSLRLYHFLCPNEMIWTSSKRNPKIRWIGKLNSSPFTQKLELSIAKYILEVSVANLLISSYSSGSAIESG